MFYFTFFRAFTLNFSKIPKFLHFKCKNFLYLTTTGWTYSIGMPATHLLYGTGPDRLIKLLTIR